MGNYRWVGSEIRRGLVDADPFAPKVVPKPRKRGYWRFEREGMSDKHLALIRQLPCTCCPSTRQIEAHHLKSLAAGKERGTGLKATDRWAVPLCKWQHHADIERLGSRREVEWFAQFGIDPHALATALWNATGNLDKMRKVLAAHKEHAAGKVSGASQ